MYIATTRFNNITYIENKLWRLSNDYNGCIYSLPHKISNKIKPYKKIIVIEMNNDLNLITGIGCVKNYTKYNKTLKIHKEQKYNRYIYRGNKRVSREKISNQILEHLEHLLFKTSKHCKRLRGITCIPVRRLGEKIDNNFNIGCKVKKIKGDKINTTGIVVEKKGDKIKVMYNENGEIKFWSFRYALKNYIKLNSKEKKVKKQGPYKCSLCGQYKKNHNCLSLIYSKELKDNIYNYLISLF